MTRFNNNLTDTVSFARFESVTDSPKATETVRASVHDALWMLSQQYRVGEYNAEDAGTPYNVRVYSKKSKITRIQHSNASPVAYDISVPIECEIEKLPLLVDVKTKLTFARYWFNLLQKHELYTNFRSYFVSTYPISLLDENEFSSDNLNFYSKTNSAIVAKQTVRKLFDGFALYEVIKADKTNWQNSINGASTSQKNTFNSIGLKLLNWIHTIHFSSSENMAWSENALEYKVKLSAPTNTAATSHLVIEANDITGHNLDWIAFDKAASQNPLTVSGANDTNVFIDEVNTYMPSKLNFRGMINERWWQFEDKDIDLKYIKYRESSSTKLSLTDFALNHSNDWFLIPQPLSIGSVYEVERIMVTDVFGVHTNIIRSGDDSIKNWSRWNMYNLDKIGSGNLTQNSDGNLFIVPKVLDKLESEPIERVAFYIDEMSNIVWGIEEIIPDFFTQAISGKTASSDLINYIDANAESRYNIEFDELFDTEQKNAVYRIDMNIQNNWIPFITVPIQNSNRTIRLRRATSNRVINNYVSDDLIRPQTYLLRNSYRQNEISPLYINEEEILRSGIIVKGAYKRARWSNGKCITWYARTKHNGTGESYSGVKFDTIAEYD